MNELDRLNRDAASIRRALAEVHQVICTLETCVASICEQEMQNFGREMLQTEMKLSNMLNVYEKRIRELTPKKVE